MRWWAVGNSVQQCPEIATELGGLGGNVREYHPQGVQCSGFDGVQTPLVHCEKPCFVCHGELRTVESA